MKRALLLLVAAVGMLGLGGCYTSGSYYDEGYSDCPPPHHHHDHHDSHY